ncbi:MAG: ATP synthase F1 subunit delta [Oscillospiraceae bacterium]|nr:ATP synthase F1 subunit delta [Oscillospiraceae bacterium]
MSTEIGSVYANALFSLAQEQGDAVLRQTRQDLRQCAVLFSLYPDFGRLLSLPTLSLNTRCDIAQKAFGSEDLVSRLLLLLIDHNRIPYVGEIADAFDARMLDYERTAEVLVTTAVPMTPDQLERLSQKLSAKFQKTIRIKERIDRSMIGGVIVQYGDTRIDNSLKLRLEALRTQLQG